MPIAEIPVAPVRSCSGLGASAYMEQLDHYVEINAAYAHWVQEYLRTSTLRVGTPEGAFTAISCFWIADINSIETAAGVRRQVVMERTNPGLGTYVYLERGVVAAIQR